MKPSILSIDDAEDEVTPLVSDEKFDLHVIDPNDANLAEKLAARLPLASLILLDQKFNVDSDPLSLKASDGSSFVAHLRSWSRQNAKTLAPLVLFTNDEQAFENEIPAVGAALPLDGTFVGREHQIAPALDVEWVQLKAAEDAQTKLEQLIEASVDASAIIGENGVSIAELEELLELPEDQVWTDKARSDLRAARPPISQIDDTTPDPCGSTQIIRWLCHRGLPYPGMLFSDLYAAWALGISLDEFRSIEDLAADTQWTQDLIQVEYTGPLYHFAGRRWWKSGIDYLVWKLDQESLKQGDREKAWGILVPGVKIAQIYSASTHVVTWTPELSEGDISEIDACAQLRPPGWPAEALEPWILKSDLENDSVLQAMTEDDE